MAANEVVATERFQALEGMRGILCIFVMLCHFDANFHGKSLIWDKTLYYWIDCFFVFSGVLMAWLYWDKLRNWSDASQFMMVRFFRIYPLHLFWLLAFIAFEVFRLFLPAGWLNVPPFTGVYDPAKIPEHFFLIQAMGVSHSNSWNYPSWTLSTELFAYVLFAMFMIFISRARILAALGVVAFSCAVLAYFSDLGFQETVFLGYFRCLASFMLGVVLFRVYRKTAYLKARPLLMSALELLALGLFLAFSLVSNDKAWSFLTPVVAGLFVLVMCYDAGVLSRLFSHPIAVFLGTISFSMYLAHVFVQYRMLNLLRLLEHKGWGSYFIADSQDLASYSDVLVGSNLWQGDMLAIIMVVITILVSYVTYQLIEEPGRKLGKQVWLWVKSRRQPA